MLHDRQLLHEVRHVVASRGSVRHQRQATVNEFNEWSSSASAIITDSYTLG